jgi:hypothetical protein
MPVKYIRVYRETYGKKKNRSNVFCDKPCQEEPERVFLRNSPLILRYAMKDRSKITPQSNTESIKT